LKQNTKAHLALVATNVFFAINYTTVKTLFNGGFVKPFGLNMLRVLVTTTLLWVLYFFAAEKKKVDKKHYGRFLLCSVLGISLNQLLFIKGLSLTYSIHASLLILTTPILITFIAVWLLKEKITVNKILGLLLGIGGAMVLILARDRSGNAEDVLLGDVFILLNAISYTFYFVLVKPLLQAYNPVMVLRILFTLGMVMLLPFCWGEVAEVQWNTFGTKEFVLLGSITILGTFCAYLFNIYGIKVLGASTAGAYIYSQPLFAAIIAIGFLGETIELYKIIAAILIFAGVYIANKKISEQNN
jgi:drug/metabolite transporter (DMT)-like permease